MASEPKLVKVHFATNRDYVGGDDIFGTRIANPTNPSKYRTGSVDMRNTDPALPDSGWNMDRDSWVLDPEQGEGDAKTLAKRANAPESPAPDTGILAFKQAVEASDPSDFGIVLLPGFAAKFRDTLRRAAQIAAAYGAKNVYCFSWPANGHMTLDDYFDDQRDAKLSARSIALSLLRLFKDAQHAGEEPPRIELVAHSMGCFALRHAVQEIKAAADKLVTKVVFRGALLVAADDDFDSLTKPDKLAPLLDLTRRITVYTADDDRALAFSATWFVNNYARLGMFGPKDLATLPAWVTRVDVTSHSDTHDDVGGTFSHHNHQYYRLSRAVITDIRAVLAGTPPKKIKHRNPHPAGAANGRAWKVAYYKP